MKYPLTGYHHITACAGGAQEDVNFFTQVVGLRMAKQTVLMDGSIPIYHLYYSNANLEPGSVMTTFPYSRKPGRKGSGQVSATSFTVTKGSLPFWKEHLKSHKVDHQTRRRAVWAILHPIQPPLRVGRRNDRGSMRTSGKAGALRKSPRARRRRDSTERYFPCAKSRKQSAFS